MISLRTSGRAFRTREQRSRFGDFGDNEKPEPGEFAVHALASATAVTQSASTSAIASLEATVSDCRRDNGVAIGWQQRFEGYRYAVILAGHGRRRVRAHAP